MDSTVTNWAFGFGGWMGVLGSTYMLLNVPHTYTFSLVLLSPWLGGISMYLLMYMTYSWIRVSAQIAAAMTEYEIIMALLTSVVGVMVVAIGRLIIDMERSHKTPAELAAVETATPATSAETQTTEVSDSESESDTEETVEDAENEETAEEETAEDAENEENEETVEETDAENEETAEETDDESGDSATGSGEESDDEESTERTNDSVNQARIEETSFENINTPQLNGIPNTSPIPKLSDI